ncbi:MAG: DUF1254 domain-containing protein [Thermodesulfobacteriota bacterium]
MAWKRAIILVSGVFLLGLALATQGQQEARAQTELAPAEMAKIAQESYIFGYPLVLMDITRQVMTACPSAGVRCAPINQFSHVPVFPDPTFTDVVSPNVDTLYSIAWLDLSKGPMVLSVPDTKGRYYMMQMLDAWTDVFAAPGTRTTGTGKGDFAIVGPGWQGQLPPGLKKIAAPTNLVWILGRTQTNGKADYAAVHALQKQYKLTPLRAWGRLYTPPAKVAVDPSVKKTPPVKQVAEMDAQTFFSRLNHLMQGNPPAPADAPALSIFAAVGVAPGKKFSLQGLDPGARSALEKGVKEANRAIVAEAQKPQGKQVNGWSIQYDLGSYGTKYLLRAAIAWVGLGANLPQDAVYPMTLKDAKGQLLTGKHRYVLHFAPNQTPPVHAFWSLTMYNAKQALVANPLNRYALGDRDKLKFNADGSLDLYIQQKSPGKDQESNWLPAPENSFNLVMRLYWPKKPVLDGAWAPPPVQRVP